MKADIHPKYYTDVEAKCACGAIFRVGSTLESLNVEICSACHPFYSGAEKVIDTAGRVERFKKFQAIAKSKLAQSPKAKKIKK